MTSREKAKEIKDRMDADTEEGAIRNALVVTEYVLRFTIFFKEADLYWHAVRTYLEKMLHEKESE